VYGRSFSEWNISTYPARAIMENMHLQKMFRTVYETLMGKGWGITKEDNS
jgi:hypothetical protein